ncbi:MAG: AAA family ATPase [Steroidobacteraceae bacterium]
MPENTANDAWEEEVLATWGLNEPAFAEVTTDSYFFPGEQYLRALDFMRRVLCSQVSAGVLTGSKGVGKSLLARLFLASLDDRILVAHIQRTDMGPREFLLEILRQLGVELDSQDRTDRRLLLDRYLTHQVGNGRICLLIIENLECMQPQVLEELRHIACLESNGARLIKLLLLGQPLLNLVVDSPRLNKLVPAGVPRVAITGLSEDQLANYVAHRLRAAGAQDPDHLIPHTLMSLLYRLSSGTPTVVNRICNRALAVAAMEGLTAVNEQSILMAALQLGISLVTEEPILDMPHEAETAPTETLLLISVRGGVDSVQSLQGDRMLIGRSELADVSIDSAFVSRYHALIVREPAQNLLIDLGSTNGLLVNSRRVVRHVLQHRDLIQIGPARITYLNSTQAPTAVVDSSETLSFARTGAANNEHAVFAFGRFNEPS